MNYTRILKEILLMDWALRGTPGMKGDGVQKNVMFMFS